MHFAVGRYIGRSLIDRSWGHGYVHIKLLGDLPVGTGAVGEARRAVTATFVDRRSRDPMNGQH